MCLGGGVPSTPAKEPEAPTAPTADLDQRNMRRKRQRAAGSTLLTGGQGVTSSAQTDQKTLLGG